MRLKRLLVASVGGALLALPGCSDSGGERIDGTPRSDPDISNGGSTVPGMNANVLAPAAAIAGARSGGTLTVLSNEGLGPMDPTEAYYINTASILSGLVTRSLTQYVYDQASGQMILIPDLATDLGRPSLDFTRWRFTLRPGVTFENGRAVTADDLEYGIERSFDRDTFPGGADYSNRYFLDGDTYDGPYRSPGPYDGVTTDGNTITIRMAVPFPEMSYWASFPAMGPIPAGKASDPATYKKHPWATGPYMFEDYTPGRSLTLVRNPYWDPETDPGRHQYVDGFDFDFHTHSARIDQILLADTGAGQTTLSFDDVLAEDYVEFSTTASDRLIRGSLPCTFFFAPDNRKIADIRVRRALAYAFPYEDAWSAFGTIPGVTQIPATNILPPGFPGWREYDALAGHAPADTDPARAKALLAAAGKLNYPIRWAYRTDEADSVAGKNVIEAALADAGFDPHPVPSTSENYSADYFDNPAAPVNARTSGWCSDWPSGSSWFPPLFHSTDIASGGGFGENYAAFSSTAVDERIEKIPHLLLTQQEPAWNALDKLIQTEYFPVVPTGYGAVAMMRGSKVHNVFDDPTFGMPTWKDIWLG